MSALPKTADQKSKILNILSGSDPKVDSWIVKPHPTKPGFTVQKRVYQENGLPKYIFPDTLEQFADSYHAQQQADYLSSIEKYNAIAAILHLNLDYFGGKRKISIHDIPVNAIVPGISAELFDPVTNNTYIGNVSSIEHFSDKVFIRVRIEWVDENEVLNSRIARFTYKDDTQVNVFNSAYEEKS